MSTSLHNTDKVERLCAQYDLDYFSSLTFINIENIPQDYTRCIIHGNEQARAKAIRLARHAYDLERSIHKAGQWAKIIRKKQRADNVPLLKIIGFSMNQEDPEPYLVSEWVTRGNVMEYLRRGNNTIAVDKLSIIKDITEGVKFLHESGSGIVHGDIRGENVLVRQDGSCCLGEFSFETIPSYGTLQRFSKWMAPELFDIELMHKRIVDGYREYNNYKGEFKKPSDIFALACTIIEIYTGEPPNEQRIPENVLTLHELLALPRPPTDAEERLIPHAIWKVLTYMLRYCPPRRLDIFQVLQELKDPKAVPILFPGHASLPVMAKNYARRLAR